MRVIHPDLQPTVFSQWHQHQPKIAHKHAPQSWLFATKTQQRYPGNRLLLRGEGCCGKIPQQHETALNKRTYIGTAGRSKASSFLLLLLFVPSVSPRLAALATCLLYLLAFTWSAPFICHLPSNSFSLLLSTCFSPLSSLSDSPSTHPTCSSLTLYSRLPK